MNLRTILLVVPSALLLGSAPQPAPRFERVYPLKPAEGVFAYSRISPDGRFLAYASEAKDPSRGRNVTQTVTLVDLKTRKVLFTEPGIDAYFSPDGQRMIYLSFRDGGNSVDLRNHATGEVTRDVAPVSLGDYFSWGFRDGRNLILTINSRYYYLDGDQAILPAGAVKPCDGIGVGERPLLSRDGLHITTFVRGTLVVRGLTDCSDILDTGIQGAKADFSFDGRYIAFHAPKANGNGYDIQVVDLQQRTVRTITNMAGSSLFPSWTKDGRLSFRYDGDDYRGFMTASDVLSAPARPLAGTKKLPASRGWTDVFPETAEPDHDLNLVMIWGTWSAHSPIALGDLQRARDYFAEQNLDVGVLTATDPGSQPADIRQLLQRHEIQLPQIPLAPERLSMTEALNQIPTTLLFRDGRLIDRRLGAQSFPELQNWVATMRNKIPYSGSDR